MQTVEYHISLDTNDYEFNDRRGVVRYSFHIRYTVHQNKTKVLKIATDSYDCTNYSIPDYVTDTCLLLQLWLKVLPNIDL